MRFRGLLLPRRETQFSRNLPTGATDKLAGAIVRVIVGFAAATDEEQFPVSANAIEFVPNWSEFDSGTETICGVHEESRTVVPSGINVLGRADLEYS
jgi:hypothetical protein